MIIFNTKHYKLQDLEKYGFENRVFTRAYSKNKFFKIIVNENNLVSIETAGDLDITTSLQIKLFELFRNGMFKRYVDNSSASKTEVFEIKKIHCEIELDKFLERKMKTLDTLSKNEYQELLGDFIENVLIMSDTLLKNLDIDRKETKDFAIAITCLTDGFIQQRFNLKNGK